MATKTQYQEGDYVPGKGILTPYGTYKKTAAEKTTTKSPASAFTLGGLSFGSQSEMDKFISKNKDNPYVQADVKKLGTNASNESSYGYYVDGKFVPFRNEEAAILSGYYGEEAADELGAKHSTLFEPKLKAGESAGIAKEYGLQGMSDEDFIGLTRTQAIIKAKQLNKQKQGQVSQLTSFNYNPESISGFKRKFDEMKFKIDESNNDAWANKNERKTKNQAILDSYTDQFAGMFNSQDELRSATQDKEFQKLLSQYESMGGSLNKIASKVGKTPSVSVTNEVLSPDDTYTSNEAQTLDQYLGNLTSSSDKKAFESLIPEKQVYQDQISFEQSIPEQYKAMYFGTPEQVGLIQQRRQQAQEEIKLLERRAKLDEKNIKAQADYAVERNRREMNIESDQIEENRLAAKNYMTGMLAKLGALNTTGAAPQALSTLEHKYQKQSQQLRSNYQMANRDIELKLQESVDNIQLKRDQDILDTKSDLSKSEEDVWKEIFKLQNDADRKTLGIIEKYTSEFRSQREKYSKEAKAEAEKYANSFASVIDATGILEGDIVIKRNKTGKISNKGVLAPLGDIRSIESILESSKGSDGYVNSATYKEMFDKFINAGGTRSEFLSAFPPNRYVNPKDSSLPSFLKFGSSSRAEADEDEEEPLF